MKIQMTKRKPGIYAQWFEVIGINENGQNCCFLIYHSQAKNYAQAVRFWTKMWGSKYNAILLRNADPLDISMAC